MSSHSYSALIDACGREPDLHEFVRFRLEDIGNARNWPEGHEFKVFENPSPDDVDELVRRIRHEASLRWRRFRLTRAMAVRALGVMGL